MVQFSAIDRGMRNFDPINAAGSANLSTIKNLWHTLKMKWKHYKKVFWLFPIKFMILIFGNHHIVVVFAF